MTVLAFRQRIAPPAAEHDAEISKLLTEAHAIEERQRVDGLRYAEVMRRIRELDTAGQVFL